MIVENIQNYISQNIYERNTKAIQVFETQSVNTYEFFYLIEK